uniref:NADH-ubiquinone oxidoreductase chain 3 n=1 Tax=Aposthonia borneensis TaxID=1208762 RepID=A0A678PDN1_9NEOP|nr:NADH dehydrogenase subunit 3 [Aposthonia borneensis]
MSTLMKSFIMSLIITTSIIMIAMSLSKKNNFNQEKSSAFECGFDPKKKARQPFSLHFFLITLLFLIFDTEVALILPFIPSINSNLSSWSITMILFFFILILSTYYERMQGILNWN